MSRQPIAARLSAALLTFAALAACGADSVDPAPGAPTAATGAATSGVDAPAGAPRAETSLAPAVRPLDETGSSASACTGEPGAPNTFYVSAAGDDAAAGTSPATAWRSLSRVQRALASLAPGHRVLFARGHVFAGALSLDGVKGTAAAPIVFGAYCTGADPVISGFSRLGGWMARGGNVYEASCPDCPANLNLLAVDGQPRSLARHPDADAGDGGYLYWDSASGKVSITDDAIAGTDWSGASVAVRSRAWVLDRVRVTGQSGGTLALAAGVTYPLEKGFGYFLMNHPAALNRDGEWTWDATTRRIRLYSDVDPASRSVLAGTRARLLSLRGASFLVFDGLALRGANDEIVFAQRCDGVVLRRVTVQASGGVGVAFEGCRNVEVSDTTVHASLDTGLSMPDCPACSVRRSRITESGTIPGMGRNSVRRHLGAQIGGAGMVFDANVVAGSGYNGLDLAGNATVTRNHVSGFNRVLSDGGGIYMFRRDGQTTVSRNTVSDGVGVRAGTPYSTAMTHGIYVDDDSVGVVVSDNVVLRAGNAGIMLHNNRNGTVTGNTVMQHRDANILLMQDSLSASGNRNTGMVIRGNTLVDTSGKPLVWVKASEPGYDFAGFARIDANRYCTPYGNPVFLRDGPAGEAALSLADWRALGHDPDATTCPVSIPATTVRALAETDRLDVALNPSATRRTVVLAGPRRDLVGTLHAAGAMLTVEPYSALLLIPAR